MVRLDFMLLLYRGVSYRKKRDDLQIIVLGLFLVMVAGVLTVSLEFALQILVFTAGTLAFLFVITLTEAAEAGVAAAGSAGAGRGRRAGGRRRAAGLDGGALAAARPPPAGGGRLAAARAGRRAVRRGRGGVGAAVHRDSAVPARQRLVPRSFHHQDRAARDFRIRSAWATWSTSSRTTRWRSASTSPIRRAFPATPYWRMVVLDEYRDGEFQTSRRAEGRADAEHPDDSFLRAAPASPRSAGALDLLSRIGRQPVPAARRPVCAAAVPRAAMGAEQRSACAWWRCATSR